VTTPTKAETYSTQSSQSTYSSQSTQSTYSTQSTTFALVGVVTNKYRILYFSIGSVFDSIAVLLVTTPTKADNTNKGETYST
jgi:hypothetical protein